MLLNQIFCVICLVILFHLLCFNITGDETPRNLLDGHNQSSKFINITKYSGVTLASSNSSDMGKDVIAKKVAIAEKFVSELAAEDYSLIRKYFDNTMSETLPTPVLKRIWEALKCQCGSFKQIIKVQTKQTDRFLDVSVTCEFTFMPIDVKVAINEDNKVSGLHFLPVEVSYEAPSYVNPNAFDEMSVTIGMMPWTLPGILSIPKGDGLFAAVVLVHGSGPDDRDETIGSNKPFRDLAWGLASRGIAVLRYDKRTYIYRNIVEKIGKNFTVNEETIEDAVAAVAFLHRQPRISKDKIYALGHSMGGMLIPRIVLREPSLAGLIIMAGNTTPLEDLVVKQTEYLASLDGEISKDERNNIANIKKKVQEIKELKHHDINSTEMLLFETPPAYWLDLQEYNPTKVARELDKPILILQGERDYQVSMEDFNQWRKELISKNNVKFILYPNLNHLFMEGEGKSGPLEYLKPSHVAESVIIDIAEWLIGKSITSNNIEK